MKVQPASPPWLPWATAPVGIFLASLIVGHLEARRVRAAKSDDEDRAPDRPENPDDPSPPGGESA
jgi:hypothetical protein